MGLQVQFFIRGVGLLFSLTRNLDLGVLHKFNFFIHEEKGERKTGGELSGVVPVSLLDAQRTANFFLLYLEVPFQTEYFPGILCRRRIHTMCKVCALTKMDENPFRCMKILPIH